MADFGFGGGDSGPEPATSRIAATNDAHLNCSEGWNPAWATTPLAYAFSVPNSSYHVRLHPSEGYPPNFARGKRVIDALAEGRLEFPVLLDTSLRVHRKGIKVLRADAA